MGILSILWFKLLLLYKTYHLLLEFSLSLYINLNDTNHLFIFYNFNTIKSNHYRRCHSIPDTEGCDPIGGCYESNVTGGCDVTEGSNVTFTTGGSNVLALDIEGGSDINTSLGIEGPLDIEGGPDIGLDSEIDGMIKDPYKGIDRELFNLNNDFHNYKFSKITKPLYHKPIKYHEEIINTNTINTTHEVTSTKVQSNSLRPPPEVTTSVPLGVEPSSNYLSLKGDATPGDRGDKPVADLREAKGEINKEGRLQDEDKVGNEVRDWTSSGENGIMGLYGDKKPHNTKLPHDLDILPHNSPPEVTSNSVPLAVEASSNYLSLKSIATPRDRGGDSDVTSSGLPAADLREAEGEVNREAVCKTTSGVTASGNVKTLDDICLPIRPCRYKSDISYEYISDEMVEGILKRYRWRMLMKDDIDDGLISLVMNHRIRFSYIMGMMMKLVYNNNDINIINNIIKKLSKLDIPITYTLYEGYALLYLKSNRIELSLNMIENIIKTGYIIKHKYYESLFIYLEEQLDINNLLLLLKHSIYKSKLKFTGFWFIRILLVILYNTQNKLYHNQSNIINILYNMKSNIITLLNLYLSYHINTFSISTRLAFILQHLYNLFIPNLITLTNVSPTHEVTSTIGPTSIPPKVTTTMHSLAESSSNYLSLKGDATPRDRGSEDGSYWTSSGSGLPVADLREAKGEINRRGTTTVGREVGDEVMDWTSGGKNGALGGYGDKNTIIITYPIILIINTIIFHLRLPPLLVLQTALPITYL